MSNAYGGSRFNYKTVISLQASSRARVLGFFGWGGGGGWVGGGEGKERELAAMSQKFECLS